LDIYISFLVIKVGTYQIRPHRLRAKSHQWIWVNCSAVIETQTSIKRVRCNYRVANMESVKKFKEKTTFTELKSIEVPLPFSTVISSGSNSQSSHFTTTVSNTVVHSLSIMSPLLAIENGPASFRTTDDSSSEQANDSVSIIASGKHTSNSCAAKIVIGPLPPKRMRKGGSNEATGSCRSLYSDNTPSTSFEHTSSLCQLSSTALSSPSSETLPSKRRNQIPLAFIEHYPLPDSKLTTAEVASAANDSNESRVNVLNLASSSTSMMTPAALSISPMYQQVWEELQRRSEILRQQVFQKEMELRELHLKRFLASIIHGDKC
uniref:NEDD4-binding protein 1 n=1 Tax=Elaeophora elaphi TaxID=1147741 RepID=A0A158Q8I5_9BILA